MLNVGDKVVHPQHGAGTIEGIEECTIDGRALRYYAFRPALDDIKILIQVDACEKSGIRPVCTKKEAEELLKKIEALPADDSKSWNQRYRENLRRLNSGDLLEVAKAAKCLYCRDRERALPAGEKKMLLHAKTILDSEIAFALNVPFDEIEKRMNALIG